MNTSRMEVMALAEIAHDPGWWSGWEKAIKAAPTISDGNLEREPLDAALARFLGQEGGRQ